MAILNNRKPIQVFFQSATLSFRKIENDIVIEFENKIFKLTWAQSVTLISFLHDTHTMERKEQIIRDFSKGLPRGKWVKRKGKMVIMKHIARALVLVIGLLMTITGHSQTTKGFPSGWDEKNKDSTFKAGKQDTIIAVKHKRRKIKC